MRLIAITIIFILFYFNLSAQDSLKFFLNELKHNPTSPTILNRVSFFYSEIKKDSCYFYAQKAYKLAQQNTDTIEMAKALANLGESKTNLGQQDVVLDNYNAALKLFDLKKDYYQISRMHNKLGILYNEMGDNSTAIKHYREAIAIQHKHHLNKKIEYIYNNLATSLYNVDNYEEAILYLDSAIAVYKKTGNIRGISYAHANLGMVYIYKKDYPKAKMYLDQSYQIIKKNNDILKIISNYKLYGLLYMHQEKKELALAYADSALQVSLDLNFIEITNSTYSFYSMIHKHFNEYKEALEYLEKYMSTNDSLKNIEKTRMLTDAKVRFDMVLNEQKIENLSNENALNKLQISSQRKWIWTLVGSVIILIGLLGVIIFFKRGKYLAEKKLVEKGIEKITDQKPIIKKEDIIEDLIEDTGKYERSSLTETQKDALTEEIIDLFENKKIYLDPECSITMLENKLETNKSYISQVINEKFEQNFKSILKEYRIKEATILLLSPENRNLTIEAISQKVGFKSKSVFNSTFKSILGITPSFFQKENLK